MLPDEAADAAILQDCFEGAVRCLVSHCRTMNGYIVDVGDRVLGNLQLKDVCYVIMENGDCISPTHWEFGEMGHTVWCLKGGVIARCFSECAFVVADIQVEHSSTGMTCKLLSDLFSEGSDTRMLDGDGIEGFETVDWANGIGFFLCYTEPARAV